jgi:hypothetical protein
VSIESDAVDALTDRVRGLVPDPDAVFVWPTRISPTGLGGLVGGEVYGRRVRADVLVTVRSDDGLDAAVTELAQAMALAERADGLLEVRLKDGGEPVADAQRVTFDVLYEHLAEPAEGEGVIETIPAFVDAAPFVSLFAPRVGLGVFQIVDDPLADTDTPSRWRAVGRRIEQRSAIHAGAATRIPRKPGTYLVARRPPVRDFVLRAELSSASEAGIGLVFRFVDPSNFLYFLMQADNPVRQLARKAGGTFSDLTPPLRDPENGFTPGVRHRIEITAVGTRLAVRVDGEPALEGDDDVLTGPGRVGLMCHRNDAAAFHSLDLMTVA